MDLALFALAGFAVALAGTPVGVSGAFLLVPFQTVALSSTSPGVSATNLLFNVLSTPGGLWRYGRQGSIDAGLARLVLAGSVPAMCLGVWCRVHVLAEPRTFRVVAGLVLAALAGRLVAVLRRGAGPRGPRRHGVVRGRAVIGAAALVGFVGGLYGIGGGSLLAPVLVGTGVAVADVAGAALVATGVTSLVGLAAFIVLAATGAGPGPDWTVGIALGAGGAIGSHAGARVKHRLPERTLTALLAGLAALAAISFLVQATRS